MGAPIRYEELRRMSAAELRALFRSSPAPEPETLAGDYAGTVLTGTSFPLNTKAALRLLGSARLPWKGKRLGRLVEGRSSGANRVEIGGRPSERVPFRVVMSTSSDDGRPACSLLYAVEGAPKLLGRVRDELRSVGEGVLLGRGFLDTPLGPAFELYFALERIAPTKTGDDAHADH